MVRPTKISGIIRQDTAVGFYRLVQPIRFLLRKELFQEGRITPFSGRNELGEGKDAVMSNKWIEESAKNWKEMKMIERWGDRMIKTICHKADIIWSNIIVHPDEMLKTLNLRKWTGAKLIIDIDDNIFAVSKDNPGEKNTKAFKENLSASLMIADGVTVSVPLLKDVYSHLNKNIFINPNGIDFSIFKKLKKKKHRKLRIGWAGAYGHRADLEMIYPAVAELKKKHKFDFVVFGVTPKEGIKKPPFPVEWHEWVSFGAEKDKKGKAGYPYYEKMAELGLDIVVAPLIDSSYNRCKSNLRILENSALKTPVVASPVDNYRDMPIFYASTNWEWYNRLEKLIVDKNLRVLQGDKQYRFALNYFDMSGMADPLYKWMVDLKRRKDLEPKR